MISEVIMSKTKSMIDDLKTVSEVSVLVRRTGLCVIR